MKVKRLLIRNVHENLTSHINFDKTFKRPLVQISLFYNFQYLRTSGIRIHIPGIFIKFMFYPNFYERHLQTFPMTNLLNLLFLPKNLLFRHLKSKIYKLDCERYWSQSLLEGESFNMKFVCVIFLVTLCAAGISAQFSKNLDNLNVDMILKNDRIIGNYVKCLLDKGI